MSFTVTFDKNSDDATGEMQSQTFSYTEEGNLSANTFAWQGYAFSAWNTEADGSGISYNDGVEFKKIAEANNPNVKLYAQWEAGAAKYTVRHYKQNLEQTSYDEVSGDTKELWGLTGKSTSAVALEYDGFSAREIEQAEISADGTTEVKIYYDRNTCTVSFDADNGSAISSQNVVYEAKANEPPAPEKSGYTFGGWYNGDTIFDFNQAIKSDTKIIARWTAISYTIKYNLNGTSEFSATNSSENSEKYTVESNITFKNPTRKGYNFCGWYTSENFATGTEITGTQGKTEAIEIYAKWEETTHKINYHIVSGQSYGKISDNWQTSFKEIEGVTLPCGKEHINEVVQNYFTKFYTDEALTEEVSGWQKLEKTYDVDLYIKYCCTTETAESAINALENTETEYAMYVTGAVSDTTISKMREALVKKENAGFDLNLIEITGLTTVPHGAFKECKSLTAVELPYGIITIEYEAFFL